ncbi:MAG TPA: Mpo1-like protein [Isosphaeraceae bacterium]|jgi:hypothetical protein|nr:Mpo1-like protein [Isosphaeraceae bacterium]
MLCPPHQPCPIVSNWLERHCGPVSFVLHMIGIPPTILGVVFIPIYVFLVSVPVFLLALTLFVGGYLAQFLGHALEGSMPGELMLLKKRRDRRRERVAAAAAAVASQGRG